MNVAGYHRSHANIHMEFSEYCLHSPTLQSYLKEVSVHAHCVVRHFADFTANLANHGTFLHKTKYFLLRSRHISHDTRMIEG